MSIAYTPAGACKVQCLHAAGGCKVLLAWLYFDTFQRLNANAQYKACIARGAGPIHYTPAVVCKPPAFHAGWGV